jgi:2-methylcitrate dehydratase PrpD
MTDMAEFTAELTPQGIPAEMAALLRRSFLDTMGVAAIGATTELSAIATRVAPVLFGAGAAPARMLMHGGPVSPAGAAMQGAFTIDSVDAHDSISLNKGHAGSAVFPAILAMADSLRASGDGIDGATFLVWAAIGYEVSARAGQVQHATCADYHTSGAWTAVGVAAAAARALGLSPDQIRHAAGIGEYHGPRSQMMRCIDHPTMVRDGVGWGAPSGVTAAYLAAEGFTGAPALTCDSAEGAPFWADLGHDWRTVEYTSYKPYPCCRWAHPAIDGARDLIADHGLHHSQVKSVDIRTFHNATRLAGHSPQTPCEFAYSIAFPVAAMIVRGQIGVPELQAQTLKDADILRISQATRLIDDPDLTERSSSGIRWAQVTLELMDGTRLEAPERIPRGDPDTMLSDAEISAKFHLFSDGLLGFDRANRIEAAAGHFDQLDKNEFGNLLDDLLMPIA